MNILAHSFLSFGHPQLTVGNFIADQLKGTDFSAFPVEIQKGIQLHRAIDEFTDTHPLYKQSCRRIFDDQGHYARVVIDIVYDHYLAKDWNLYSNIALADYAVNFYKLLNNHKEYLPETSKYALHHMERSNWLLMYASIEGIDRIFNGMHSRANYNSSMDQASQLIFTYQDEFQKEFVPFFEEINLFCTSKLKQL